MELTVEKYREMKANRMTDREILKHLHYSESYMVGIAKWKRDNNIKKNESMLDIIGLDNFIAYHMEHNYKETADHFGMQESTVRWWAWKLRKQGKMQAKPQPKRYNKGARKNG